MPIDSKDLGKADFEFIRELVYSSSAIVLDAGKEYLVETRLRNIALEEGLTNIIELIARVRKDNNAILRKRIVEAITTNETSFFRDLFPFESLRKTVIPEIIEKRQASRSLKIWSAACSTGQEPYTLAMILEDSFPQLANWDVKIFATDINTQVLDKAKSGVYSQMEIGRGLPSNLLVKYFKKEEGHWKIQDRMKSRVSFSQMNLASEWPVMPIFDIILLRNVLIYFNVDTKKKILEKMRRCSGPGSYLLLGSAEGIIDSDIQAKRIEIGKTSYLQFT